MKCQTILNENPMTEFDTTHYEIPTGKIHLNRSEPEMIKTEYTVFEISTAKYL